MENRKILKVTAKITVALRRRETGRGESWACHDACTKGQEVNREHHLGPEVSNLPHPFIVLV
jgi:hypothetical protein